MYLSSVDVGVFIELHFLRPWKNCLRGPQSQDQELLVLVHKKLGVSFHILINHEILYTLCPS